LAHREQLPERQRMSATAPPSSPAPSASRLHAARPALAALARHRGWWAAAGIVLLVAASVYLRTQAITAKFWIDEGLSVGIAHHSLLDIPSVLRRDGSPPLYYLLLHVWMGLVGGDGEVRTHALSVAFATLTVPTGWWAGRRLFGPRSGWATAALAATCPFLTYYAQETRMYALVALLGFLATGAFALAYAKRERWAIPMFSLTGVLTVYAHNWGLFLMLGFGAAFLVLWRTETPELRRGLLRDGLLGFGGMVLLYLPWVPTLLFQASHTGAPWSERPDLNALLNGMKVIVGTTDTALVIALLGLAGLATLRHGTEPRPRARAAMAIGVGLVAGVLLAWIASQASPAWATRYFAVFVGPGLLLAGAGLVRFGRFGIFALLVILVLWFNPRVQTIKGKSDAYRVARTLKDQGMIARGDLVVAVHPEQGPLMRYYLGPGYRWADAMGPVTDNRVFDWRDALERFRAAGPKRTLAQLAPLVAPGQHLILIQPIIRTARWGAPWTAEIRHRAPQWERAVNADPRFERIAPVPNFTRRPLPRGVRAVVYLRR
jgi:mannosyltransferase